MIKPLVGKEFFCFWSFVSLQEWRLVPPPRKFNLCNSWISTILNKKNWLAFLMTVGSISRLLTRMGSKKVLIKLRPYFVLLKPNTGNTLQYRSRDSWRSFNWFFWICKDWMESHFSFSQSSWFMSNPLTCSRRLWRWVIFSKMLPSLIFFVVSISKSKFFIFALLCAANFSRAPMKDATRWWGSELQKKTGSSPRCEETDTEISRCFPIHVVVFVSLKVSSRRQIDSKSNFA